MFYLYSMKKEELRKVRAELEMTQAELAERLEIAKNTVTRYEIGDLAIPQTVALAVSFLLLEHRKKVADGEMKVKKVSRGKK